MTPARHVILTIVALAAAVARGDAPPKTLPEKPHVLTDVDAYPYPLGTQTIGASYGFTAEPRLIETARAIAAMGSNNVKFAMGKAWMTADAQAHGITSLATQATNDPACRAVLDMPFAHTFLWAYRHAPGWWADGMDEANLALEHRELYDLAAHLLRAYDGTGRTFYLGHWEGDWHLTPPDKDLPARDVAIAGMIQWLDVRQRAIDDAKRDVPHANVNVFGYVEVNRVRDAMTGEKRRVASHVLPHVDVDYVSYSAYDSLAPVETRLPAALDYIESKLRPRPGIAGKRVFIGEYGFPAEANDPRQQDARTRDTVRAALRWGCPFVLYWELYNNEVAPDGAQRGYWLITDKNEKVPAYWTHAHFNAWAKRHVADAKARTGRVPTYDAFRAAAIEQLDALPNHE